MYAGVDIGGTKTLVAVLNGHGEIIEQHTFPTPKQYDRWLLELQQLVAELKHQDFKAGGIGAPGYIDRQHGRLISQPNLPWKNIPLQADCERVFACPCVLENDANMAALSEAMLHPNVERVLYVTISTGIGTGLIYQRRLDPSMLAMEGGNIILPYKDRLLPWEKFASGHAVYEHFGRKAMDIPASDTQTWRAIVRNLEVGLFANIAITQPELVIIGGSMGTYFDRYGELLQEALEKHRLPVVDIPKIVAAQRPETAVIYGCYDLAKQVYGHAAVAR